MIYLYEVDSVDQRTGYGGLFSSLALSLLRSYGGQVATYKSQALPQPVDADVEIFFGQPYPGVEQQFSKRRAPLRGVYTMFEQPQIPWEFVFCVEKYFDFVIVPTEWCAGVFRRIFPSKRIYVSQAGVDCDLYPFMERPMNRKPFTILWQGFHIKDRKRYDLALEAFKLLDLPDARLIIKVFSRATESQATYYLHDKQTRVSWIADACSHVEKLSLWQQCDFAVCPSNGEGIGMMPLEWMATGLPCAFTNNTGAAQFCDERYNYPLAATEQGNYRDGVPFTCPSMPTVAAAIQHAYNSREELRLKAAIAANWVRRTYSMQYAAESLMSVVELAKKELRGVYAA